MTKNQLQYQKNFEERRHNRELEAQGLQQIDVNRAQAGAAQAQASAALQQAAVAAARNVETQRHNLVSERQATAKTVIEGVSTGIEAAGKVAKIAASMS